MSVDKEARERSGSISSKMWLPLFIVWPWTSMFLLSKLKGDRYNMKLFEDERVNRMEESLELFAEICNSRWFTKTAIVLFLNKSDLFREKISHVSLQVLFPEFPGTDFISRLIPRTKQFWGRNPIYSRQICFFKQKPQQKNFCSRYVCHRHRECKSRFWCGQRNHY